MKRILTFVAAAFLAASVSYGDAVTNTVKWNVPWGDRFRERAIETLDSFQAGINSALAGTSVALASNEVFIGNSLGKAVGQTLSGFFTITTGGVASATTTGLALTNATVATTITPQAPSAVTPTISVTPQAPSAVTPTITLTPATGNAVSSIGLVDEAPAAVTPTITVTKQFGAVTATAVITPQTVSLTDTNGVTAIVWTNATCAVTIVGGDAVMTNATAACSELPAFLTNTVLSYSSDIAAWTNATAASSELPLFATNATATCSALPLFATNATAASTVTPATATFAKP
jgi:hypothetical protein